MRCGDYTVQAPLLLGEQFSEAEILGAVVWLWRHSPMHRDAPLSVLPMVLLPVIKREQYVLVSQGGCPVCFLSWMWLNMESEARYLTEPSVMIRNEDWCSGDRMWFRDFVAPFGHTPEMLRLLRHDVMSSFCARSLWHRSEIVRPCIKTFRGSHITREEFRAWKLLCPPQTGLLQC
ncbi:toxin-activating lysine-acyltransferase [Citrobacter amalonaticus]|uniref:toxin-activating lysine-acyltransferase n=1 Tax=Citrobacter amalonaticus TaxID=35703 RepID=UPI001A34A8BB|nr:toxin-activating lysine-acyltransferase [Citrobacter amalonaticus]HDQ2813319.1 toxin-activating lysine-acyltransferase [Citrobacter amalonaticus]